MRGSTIARAAVAVALVTVAARVVGLVRMVVLAATVGDSGFLGNTYASANLLPNVVFEVVAGGALASLVVPVLAAPVERGDVGTAERAASGLLTRAVVVLVPAAVLGAVFARPLMTLLSSGVEDEVVRDAQIDLGARMLIVFMPQVVLYGVGIVLAGLLQSHRRFLGPALAPLLSSLVVIGTYVLYAQGSGSGLPGEVSRRDELVLSVGTTLGVVVLSLSLLLPASRLGLRLRPLWRLPDGVGARIRRLAVVGAVGVVAQQGALLIATIVANAEPGAVIAYQLSYAVFLLPWGVLAVPLATSAFPTLAAQADGDRLTDYSATLATAVRAMVVVCAGASAALWAVHRPLARLLPFMPEAVGGAVGREAVGDGIKLFVIGLLPYGLLALLTRALFARGRTAAAGVATVAGFAVTGAGCLLGAALAPSDPVAVIGLAHSLGMITAAALLIASVLRDTGMPSLAGAARTACLAVPSAVVAAVVGEVAADGLEPSLATTSLVSTCAIAGVVVGLVYVAGLAAGRSPELATLADSLRRRTSHE
ncbi:MAG TPA: lipid II flippase MurJ [Mycobacteriales bacterium]|nr:lipid II flippase MurJ [Mycobacteriales bacterium]